MWNFANAQEARRQVDILIDATYEEKKLQIQYAIERAIEKKQKTVRIEDIRPLPDRLQVELENAGYHVSSPVNNGDLLISWFV